MGGGGRLDVASDSVGAGRFRVQDTGAFLVGMRQKLLAIIFFFSFKLI